MQQTGTAGQRDIHAHLACQQAGQPGHLHAAVSYTHLDVYKRQQPDAALFFAYHIKIPRGGHGQTLRGERFGKLFKTENCLIPI